VDVRTEDEFAAGRIPGAVNIPLSEVEFAFSLPEKKFTETFGISKPGMADLIITSCKVTVVKTFHCVFFFSRWGAGLPK